MAKRTSRQQERAQDRAAAALEAHADGFTALAAKEDATAKFGERAERPPELKVVPKRSKV